MIGSGRDGDPVKIGVAANVAERLKRLQVGSPVRLLLVASEELTPETVRKAEAECHRLLIKSRAHGEWFSVTAQRALEVVRSVIERRPWETWSRGHSLNMRVTAAERNAIAALAKNEGLPVATFIVWLLRKEAKERGIEWPE